MAYQCREKGKGNTIHGLVWCNTSLCDLCLVTEMGLELVKLTPKLDGVKLVKHEKRAVDWFHYYHPCRTLLLCSGKDHSCLQPLQLLPDKLLKLPDFDPTNPFADALYGYDCITVFKEVNRQQIATSLEPFDLQKHFRADDKSGGPQGQSRDTRQGERDRRGNV